jgi:hypothetical protein
MRNYELINEIYAELLAGNGKGQFNNPYLNTVITLTKLIEKERPSLKEVALAMRNTPVQYAVPNSNPDVELDPSLEETRFE